MDIKFPHMSVFVVRYADQWFNSYDNLSKAEKKFRQLEQLSNSFTGAILSCNMHILMSIGLFNTCNGLKCSYKQHEQNPRLKLDRNDRNDPEMTIFDIWLPKPSKSW